MDAYSEPNKTGAKQGISFFEDYLAQALLPVEPRPEFVQTLGMKLAGVNIEPPRAKRTLRYIALGIAGALSSVIILVTGIRATFTLIGTIRILREVRAQVRGKSASPIPPTVS